MPAARLPRAAQGAARSAATRDRSPPPPRPPRPAPPSTNSNIQGRSRPRPSPAPDPPSADPATKNPPIKGPGPRNRPGGRDRLGGGGRDGGRRLDRRCAGGGWRGARKEAVLAILRPNPVRLERAKREAAPGAPMAEGAFTARGPLTTGALLDGTGRVSGCRAMSSGVCGRLARRRAVGVACRR